MTNQIKLLFKLLRQNISGWQIAGFVIANLLGGAIILLGSQAYRDFDRFMEKESGLLSEGYVVVTKPISGLSTLKSLLGIKPVFNGEEIEKMRQHPAVSDIGLFSTANFQIRGSFSLGELNISTDLFMESVPDKFIDVKFSDESVWHADIDTDCIPVIIPRKYLNIYNYGYASTKGLPQLGEGLTSAFPISMTLAGNGQTRRYQARIVGYTDRLNTILVPETFLEQANAAFASKEPEPPSRLIVATTSKGRNTSFIDYLEQNGYSIEGDLESLRLQAVVHGILWVVIGIGSVVSVLAFVLLLISIQLLIEKNKDKFINLHSLGYSVSQIAAPYSLLIAAVDVAVWLVSACVVSLVYPELFAFISAISPDVQLASLLPLWIVAAVLALLFVVLHRIVIVRQIRRVCR
ncbi:MAG: hypothetical protein U0K35_07010 [Prevotella sp.]|nr:hypothetical protein [Prevotella sp.]